jgi:hypothetical protein
MAETAKAGSVYESPVRPKPGALKRNKPIVTGKTDPLPP